MRQVLEMLQVLNQVDWCESQQIKSRGYASIGALPIQFGSLSCISFNTDSFQLLSRKLLLLGPMIQW